MKKRAIKLNRKLVKGRKYNLQVKNKNKSLPYVNKSNICCQFIYFLSWCYDNVIRKYQRVNKHLLRFAKKWNKYISIQQAKKNIKWHLDSPQKLCVWFAIRPFNGNYVCKKNIEHCLIEKRRKLVNDLYLMKIEQEF